MNRYGRMAMEHWKKFRPLNFARITDPEPFFQRLGEEAETQIIDLADALAGKDEPGEGSMEKLGRLNMARANAESQILREMVLLPSEEDELEEQKEREAEAMFGVVEITQELLAQDAERQAEREAEQREWQEELAKREAEEKGKR